MFKLQSTRSLAYDGVTRSLRMEIAVRGEHVWSPWEEKWPTLLSWHGMDDRSLAAVQEWPSGFAPKSRYAHHVERGLPELDTPAASKARPVIVASASTKLVGAKLHPKRARPVASHS